MSDILCPSMPQDIAYRNVPALGCLRTKRQAFMSSSLLFDHAYTLTVFLNDRPANKPGLTHKELQTSDNSDSFCAKRPDEMANAKSLIFAFKPRKQGGAASLGIAIA